MTPKKSAKKSWPAMVQMVKNAAAADSNSKKKASAASKRNSLHFSGKGLTSFAQAGKGSQAKRDA